MGASGSRERVITVAPEVSADIAARQNVNVHEIERQRAAAEASYREACVAACQHVADDGSVIGDAPAVGLPPPAPFGRPHCPLFPCMQ